MHIGDYLGRRAIYSPDKLAAIDSGKTPHWRFTYRELNVRADRLANWLRSQAGVGYGDRVAILAQSGVEFLDAFFACGKLGAVLTCLNWRLHWRELLQLIENTTPTVLIFSGEYTEAAANIAAESNIIRHFLHIEGDGFPASQPYEPTLANSLTVPVTCAAPVTRVRSVFAVPPAPSVTSADDVAKPGAAAETR